MKPTPKDVPKTLHIYQGKDGTIQFDFNRHLASSPATRANARRLGQLEALDRLAKPKPGEVEVTVTSAQCRWLVLFRKTELGQKTLRELYGKRGQKALAGKPRVSVRRILLPEPA